MSPSTEPALVLRSGGRGNLKVQVGSIFPKAMAFWEVFDVACNASLPWVGALLHWGWN